MSAWRYFLRGMVAVVMTAPIDVILPTFNGALFTEQVDSYQLKRCDLHASCSYDGVDLTRNVT